MGSRVERAEIAGIPVFWADVPGPDQAALLFGVGRGHETLATAGITHLVEHLALFDVAQRREKAGGWVDHVRTVFVDSGSQDDLAALLTSVSETLHQLPLERFELEKTVLQTEAASASHGAWNWLMGARFGACGFGLVNHDELGLNRVGTGDVSAWARERFTSSSAALWMTFEPPPVLALALPSGRAFPPPPADALPALALPAYLPSAGGGVICSFVGARSTALTVALGLLEQRVHRLLRIRRGLSYATTSSYYTLGADVAHVTFGSDCLDEHALVVRDELLEELRRFAAGGPDPSELAAVVDQRITDWLGADGVTVRELDSAATNHLLGGKPFERGELIRELRELTPQAVADAVRDILPTAILAAPTGDAVPSGFFQYEVTDGHAVDGRRYRRRGNVFPRRSPYIVSGEGISLIREAPGESVTIRFVDVVAVLERGPGRLQLVDRSGGWLRIDVNTLRGGARIESVIRSAVPPGLFVPFADHAAGTQGGIVDLARLKLGYHSRAAREIEQLHLYLQPGERVLTLAAAVRRKRGLLVLTDRRVLFLAKAASKTPRFLEIPLADVTGVRWRRPKVLRRGITVLTRKKRYGFLELTPKQQNDEFFEGLSNPSAPAVTPKMLDTTRAGVARAYALSAALACSGLVSVVAHVYAGIWLLVFGAIRLVRVHNRRRDLAAFAPQNR